VTAAAGPANDDAHPPPHDIGMVGDVLGCRRCGTPYPQTGYTACVAGLVCTPYCEQCYERGPNVSERSEEINVHGIVRTGATLCDHCALHCSICGETRDKHHVDMPYWPPPTSAWCPP